MLSIGDVTIDLDGNRVWKADQEITLGYQEFKILWALANNRGRVLTHSTLADIVWNGGLVNVHDEQHAIQATITRLRKKLGQSLITTRRGIGYGIL